uniref:Uncharacterized protein n=1 Tax=Anopheles albimanus TaxID=7167 RepID=A0A182F7R4_ANOAL
MSKSTSFQRSSPLRIPVKPCKKQSMKHHSSGAGEDAVPQAARQLLRSLHNDRRSSIVSRISIGRTVRQTACLLDQSCMDQFDDSFSLEMDCTAPLTPRRSPHLKRRASISLLRKTLKATSAGAGNRPTGGELATVSRKKATSVRKRMLGTIRKVFQRRSRPGYNKL